MDSCRDFSGDVNLELVADIRDLQLSVMQVIHTLSKNIFKN